jgi:hypothetical protein
MSESENSVLKRVCIGLGLWCAALTWFAARVWIRSLVDLCVHEQIYHRSTIQDCDSLVTSRGVLRTYSGFWDLLLFVLVVAVPLVVIAPVLFRRRNRP